MCLLIGENKPLNIMSIRKLGPFCGCLQIIWPNYCLPLSPFLARSQNCEKRLLGSSCLPVPPSVCPSLCPPSVCSHGTTRLSRLSLDWFSWNLIFEHFSTICQKNMLYMTTKIHSWSYLAYFFLRNVSDKHCRENQNTRRMFQNGFFFLKIILFMR